MMMYQRMPIRTLQVVAFLAMLGLLLGTAAPAQASIGPMDDGIEILTFNSDDVHIDSCPSPSVTVRLQGGEKEREKLYVRKDIFSDSCRLMMTNGSPITLQYRFGDSEWRELPAGIATDVPEIHVALNIDMTVQNEQDAGLEEITLVFQGATIDFANTLILPVPDDD